AQGTGSADRETAIDRDGLRVPPDHPQYRLRRVFLSREEDDGFYLGFANEGLWPLCHIAHTRPQFRTQDWDYYCAVNRKFARVVLEEMEGEKEPVVLVQDYHFALLPRMIKEQRPDARVVSCAATLKELGHKPEFLGIGVDLVDYTKGIPERLRGIERLLDRHPYYRERLTFVQIGAPSRTHIRRYQDLMVEVEQEADR